MDRRADDDRFLYEPRALWSVLRPGSQPLTSKTSARVSAPKDDLRNVSRYPIVLTKMLVCPVNYTFREFAGDGTGDAENVHNSQSAMNMVDIYLSAPYATHITDRDGRLFTTPSRGRAEPGMKYATDYASGLFGVTRWDFDKLLRLPRKSTIAFDLSAFTLPDIGWDSTDVNASIGFDEVHTGQLAGNNRQTVRLDLPALVNSRSANFPFDLDGFAASAQGTALTTWPNEGRFPAYEWNRQESNRGQYNNVFKGFAVHLDQVTMDENVQGFAAVYQGEPISPLSTRVGVRVRTVNGPSGEFWWRPGAPLALVCPTITPASVYELAAPITLGPGEQLDLEAQALSPDPLVAGKSVGVDYQLGVSFTGYAAIEG